MRQLHTNVSNIKGFFPARTLAFIPTQTIHSVLLSWLFFGVDTLALCYLDNVFNKIMQTGNLVMHKKVLQNMSKYTFPLCFGLFNVLRNLFLLHKRSTVIKSPCTFISADGIENSKQYQVCPIGSNCDLFDVH